MRRQGDQLAVPIVEPIAGPVDLESALASFARAPDAAILESSQRQDGQGRFTILACDAADCLTVDGQTTESPMALLGLAQSRWPNVERLELPVPLAGGWIGWFSYELGARLEPAVGNPPFTSMPAPLIALHFYDAVSVYDHELNRWYACAIDWPAPISARRPPVRDRLNAIRERIERADPIGPLRRVISDPPRLDLSPEAYFTKVEQARRYIEAGDIYQVNLTRRFRTRTSASPFAIYRGLRA